MQKKIIVITGGPGTGKTTLLNSLIAKGFCCYPEISRAITLAAQKEGIEQLFLENPLLFSELLLNGRKEQFENALKETANLIFIDRGLPDIIGYMDYIGDTYPDYFKKCCRETVYSQVFSLPPWEEIYETDEARYENFEQAKAIHQKIVAAYEKLGYKPIEIPKDTVENRIRFILESIEQ
ncbi:AAA family ATPase [Flavobacterium sp. NG2]|uniref:AAA family ATPase n=1 Tax=Flavobacterium sp. NG2 TaxID=3097547 RepID=UPI002A8065F4|nr:AAA family ATPase [Flavobacterium sp. NG2]WPR73247.1 AAA family ATPase [Flavobacterium sp. NG2]